MEAVSETDELHLRLIRGGVETVLRHAAANVSAGESVLEVAPEHVSIRGMLPDGCRYTSLGLQGCDVTADLTRDNSAAVPDGSFGVVVCCEVLEHVRQPFAAVRELCRMLKPGGRLYLTSPFDFRIHGPRPDCWRFTPDGWDALLADSGLAYRVVEIQNDARFLMPVWSCVIGMKA